MVHENTVVVDGEWCLDRETLAAAGLHGRLRLHIQPGEIRMVPDAPGDPEQALDELAGCLGQESAAAYDFGFKRGGLYEAR